MPLLSDGYTMTVDENSTYYEGNITILCPEGLGLDDGSNDQIIQCQHRKNNIYDYSSYKDCLCQY